MKKIIIIVMTIYIGLGFAMFFHNGYTQEDDEYCYQINELVKDVEFYIGKIKEDKILLYDTNDNLRKTFPFDGNNTSTKIKYFRKEDGNKIYFVFRAAVDDEDGILFVNDDTNSLMDGLWRLERISGNSYSYSTYK